MFGIINIYSKSKTKLHANYQTFFLLPLISLELNSAVVKVLFSVLYSPIQTSK